MQTFLAYFDIGVVVNVVIFVATLVFSQKIKDFVAGVPADLRSNLSALETSVKADVKSYQASLIAKIAPASSNKAAPPVAVAPVAPVAPVPIPAAV